MENVLFCVCVWVGFCIGAVAGYLLLFYTVVFSKPNAAPEKLQWQTGEPEPKRLLVFQVDDKIYVGVFNVVFSHQHGNYTNEQVTRWAYTNNDERIVEFLTA